MTTILAIGMHYWLIAKEVVMNIVNTSVWCVAAFLRGVMLIQTGDVMPDKSHLGRAKRNGR